MTLSTQAKAIVADLAKGGVKLGDIKKRAKEIKKDHELAQMLWSTGECHPRLLAVLIFDKALFTQEVIDQLATDILDHDEMERVHLTDWLLANQLTKSKKLITLMETWEDNESPVLRRLFWYYQARLRWMGKTNHDNTAALVDSAEKKLANEHPFSQWAMNFCIGQIGIFEEQYRARCIKLGESTGLYKDEHVSKNCTPSYLPEFIQIQVSKLEK